MTRASLLAALLLTSCTQYGVNTEAADAIEPEAEEALGMADARPTGSTLQWVRANGCEDAAPMSLTASDGTGLRLRTLTANAFVQGPIALTELQLSFDNPEERVLEGRFSITLPPGAALSRFAMEIDGRWQEGEVLERKQAQQVYEDFLHRRQDPALMEADEGNVFRARVFPIPAQGHKRITIAYSQQLAGSAEPFRLPVCGLPQLDELDVDVAFADKDDPAAIEHLTLRQLEFAPTMDLEARPGRQVDGVRAGNLAIVRVKARLDTTSADLDALTILFDTSASRGLDFRGQIDRLGRLVSEIARRHPDTRLKVAVFDQTVAEIFDGRARDFGRPHLAKITDRKALGASDLGAALDAVGARGLASARVLLIGDGVATAGATESAQLGAQVRALEAAGVRRVDALIDGGMSDPALLRALVSAGLPQDGVVVDARMKLAAVVDKLDRATKSGIAVRVPGAKWVYPTRLDGVQSGDEVLIYAALPAQSNLRVELDGAAVEDASPALHSAPEVLVARAHAQVRIEHLSALRSDSDDPQRRKTLADEIVDQSTRHRVLSDLTALLVLETEDDYRRYGIEREGLADILTVGTQGIDVVQRHVPPAPPVDPPVEIASEDAEKNKDGKVRRGAQKKATASDDGDGDGRRVYDFDDDGAEGDLAQGAPAAESAVSAAAQERSVDEPPPPPRPATTESPARNDFGGEGEDVSPRRRARRTVASRSTSSSGGSTATAPRDVDEYRRLEEQAAAAPHSAEKPTLANPWDGRFAEVMASISTGRLQAARDEVARWRADQPGDVLALIALGETLEAAGEHAAAARAYGSLIDLFPSRADIRRMAGERLDRLDRIGRALAIDTYRKAIEQRPDHFSGYRLLGFALVQDGRAREAFEVLREGLDGRMPDGRYAGVRQVLEEDLELVGAAWVAADPKARAEVEAALDKRGHTLPTTRTTRFVLNWETDANDVDLHVYDAKGGHAFYSQRGLASGGVLYADVTTGYGPECFTIEGEPKAGPYQIQAHYYRRGPMGYGMGKLQVITHDGKGGLQFEEEPFVIMRDDAYVDLTTFE
jgi:tetratricopeptide (TPR) repeat protein